MCYLSTCYRSIWLAHSNSHSTIMEMQEGIVMSLPSLSAMAEILGGLESPILWGLSGRKLSILFSIYGWGNTIPYAWKWYCIGGGYINPHPNFRSGVQSLPPWGDAHAYGLDYKQIKNQERTFIDTKSHCDDRKKYIGTEHSMHNSGATAQICPIRPLQLTALFLVHRPHPFPVEVHY